MAFNLPPPPVSNDPKDASFRDWFYKLQGYLNTVGSILFTDLGFGGSNITSIETRNHNDLQNFQGGSTNQYYHLTNTEHTDLTDGGDTTLHFHSSDRDLANATGVLDDLKGGTGFSSYATGDILYASNTNTLSKRTIGSTGDTLLVSGGVPTWSSFQTNVNANTNLRNLTSTSLLTTAPLTINADPTKFNIPAFTAKFVDNYTDTQNPTFTVLNYAGSTGHSVPNIAIQDATFISLDKDGNIYQDPLQLTPDNVRDRVEIGALIHTNRTTITSITEFTETVSIDAPAAINDFSRAIGPINYSGNVFSGNATSPLKINKSAGQTFQVGLNWGVSKKSPNVTTDAALTAPNFFYSWRNGSGNFNVVITDTVNPGFYDDGTGGALQPNGVLNPNRWQLIKLYRQQAAGSNGVALEYGQVEYTTLALAVAARSTETVVNPAIASLQFRGWLAVRGGATDLTNTADAVFITAGAFSSPVNAGSAGSSAGTMQGTYNNSTAPQITTSTTLGAVEYKRGSAADSDDVFRILNGAGTETASITGAGTLTALNVSGTNTGDQNLFGTIAVSGQSNIVADTTSDTLTLVAGANVTITTNAATDEITIAASGGGGGGSVSSVTSANADLSIIDTTTDPVITVVQSPALRSATTTIDVAAATAPTSGQVLTATSSTAATWQTPAVAGTVTSVAVSGGSTGLTTTGGPITTSGTITLTGTLETDNGGTGLTALGTAKQFLAVNSGATALEYVSPSSASRAENVLLSNLTVSTDTSYVVVGYLNPSTFSLTVNGNVAII